MNEALDHHLMRRALDQALKIDPHRTSPNPRVGCLIFKDGRILSQGSHEKVGEAHAEVMALRGISSDQVRDSEIFVTLEPCSHTGRTGPCVDALIGARPKRVIVGIEDSNPKVSGQGIRKLQENGIKVTLGVLRSECREANEDFLQWIRSGIPLLEMKVAVSSEYAMVGIDPQKRLMITGNEARVWTHRRRQLRDAVLVGVQTVIQDQSTFDVEKGISHWGRPALVVMDAELRVPTESPIWDVQDRKVVVLTSVTAPTQRMKAIESRGGLIVPVKTVDGIPGRLDIPDCLAHLAKLDIRGIWAEPGPTLLASLWSHAHRRFLLQNPRLKGAGPTVESLKSGAWQFVRQLGDDLLFTDVEGDNRVHRNH